MSNQTVGVLEKLKYKVLQILDTYPDNTQEFSTTKKLVCISFNQASGHEKLWGSKEQQALPEREPMAWLIQGVESASIKPQPFRYVYLHNAVADFRSIDPTVTSTPLYSNPNNREAELMAEIDRLTRQKREQTFTLDRLQQQLDSLKQKVSEFKAGDPVTIMSTGAKMYIRGYRGKHQFAISSSMDCEVAGVFDVSEITAGHRIDEPLVEPATATNTLVESESSVQAEQDAVKSTNQQKTNTLSERVSESGITRTCVREAFEAEYMRVQATTRVAIISIGHPSKFWCGDYYQNAEIQTAFEMFKARQAEVDELNESLENIIIDSNMELNVFYAANNEKQKRIDELLMLAKFVKDHFEMNDLNKAMPRVYEEICEALGGGV